MVLLTDFSDVIAHGITGFGEIVEASYGIPAEVTFARFLHNEALVSLWWDVCRGETAWDYYWIQFVSDRVYQEEAIRAMGREIAGDELGYAFIKNSRNSIPGTFELYTRIKSHPAHSGRPRTYGRLKFSEQREFGIPRVIVVSDQADEVILDVMSWHRDFFSIVEKVFWSAEMGCVKRDPDFFNQVINYLDVSLDDVIYIDDNPSNLVAAEIHKIFNVIHFTDVSELQDKLETEYSFQFFEPNP